MIILGNRVPYEYFITKGKGESNAGSEGLPYETGSYDAALFEAGIHNANVIEYTSVMPTDSKQISKEEGLKRLQWGEVLECIKAQSNGKKGSKISAAVITTSVIDPKGKYLGGFAVEYAGSGTKQDAEASLAESITGIIERRGYGKLKGGGNLKLYTDNVTDNGYKIHPGKIFEYENLDVTKEHGSVFTAICFVSYKIPTLNKSNYNSRRMKRRRTKSKSSKSKSSKSKSSKSKK
jgi:pyruvoyl-dependent arginine decarboxylase